MQRHGFQHIGEVIRRRYPESPPGNRQPSERGWRVRALLNQTTGVVLATVIVLTATPAAIYLLVSEQLLCSLAAFVTALGAAFGPKMYVDFSQPKAPSAADQNS